MNQSALLIDITSIQKFVFASNKLKENLGASHLISHLYESVINVRNGDFEGGGNALLFFDTNENAEKFVEEWTKSLLVSTPGINVATAIGELELDLGPEKFRESRDDLFKKLTKNKIKFLSQTIPQRHGISAEDSSNGFSMDAWNDAENNYISAATCAKLAAYEKAKTEISDKYKEIIGDKFSFTGDLGELGQSKGSENHIAVVHIDGNAMGDRFKALNGIDSTRSLSKDLEEAVENSFKNLLSRIIKDFDDPVKKEFLKLKPAKKNEILPIRPIILGGDDITFVCEGRMGIYYAKIFMEEFEKQKVSDGKPLSSCAGIAVIKTKYPFYKGYQLAEQLCANAKSRRREKGNNGSWLDFHVAYGGFSGSLKDIRDLHYQESNGSLIYRPYELGDDAEYGFNTLIKNVTKLKTKDKNGKPKYPNNKLKELREVLTLGTDASLRFVSEMKARDLPLPEISGKKYHSALFDSNVTPYFDMLELLEFYPEYELQGDSK
jgi:hypothetical protein